MENLRNINDDVGLESGTVFRIYGVNRRDVMKLDEDKNSEWKKARDYYDYLLFDATDICGRQESPHKGKFVFVNVTANSQHRGDILVVLDSDTRYIIRADRVKDYFEGSEFDLYLIRGSAASKLERSSNEF